MQQQLVPPPASQQTRQLPDTSQFTLCVSPPHIHLSVDKKNTRYSELRGSQLGPVLDNKNLPTSDPDGGTGQNQKNLR